MTCYVDDMRAPFRPRHRPGIVYIMSHMIADTDRELHIMAARIGVARRWFQRDHYDVTQIKRGLALKAGAVPITWRQAGAMMMFKRLGMSMGRPETAPDRLRQWYKEKSSGTQDSKRTQASRAKGNQDEQEVRPHADAARGRRASRRRGTRQAS